MEKEMVAGPIGPEAKYAVKLVEGKVMVEIAYDGQGVDGGAFVKMEPEYFVAKLKEAIPGKVDDMVFDLLIGALKVMG
jgi:hypothetical protein